MLMKIYGTCMNTSIEHTILVNEEQKLSIKFTWQGLTRVGSNSIYAKCNQIKDFNFENPYIIYLFL